MLARYWLQNVVPPKRQHPMVTNAQVNDFQPTISKCGLHILREALSLSKSIDHSPWSSSLLLSIDFEGNNNIRSGFTTGEECQMGIATLDTRDLQKDSLSPSKDLIKTYNYVSGSSQYINQVSNKFLFEKSVIISSANILKTIQSITSQHLNCPIIMISHGAQSELGMLRALGYRFPANLYFVDTYRVTNEVLGYCQYSLYELLRRVQCPCKNMHSGGNAAHFTLKASLLLAESGCGVGQWVYVVGWC